MDFCLFKMFLCKSGFIFKFGFCTLLQFVNLALPVLNWIHFSRICQVSSDPPFHPPTCVFLLSPTFVALSARISFPSLCDAPLQCVTVTPRTVFPCTSVGHWPLLLYGNVISLLIILADSKFSSVRLCLSFSYPRILSSVTVLVQNAWIHVSVCKV